MTVSVELDAGTDVEATRRAKEKLSAQTPAELETLLGGSVSSVRPATVAVQAAKATISWGFNVRADTVDVNAVAAALADEVGGPFFADDFDVAANQELDGTWTVNVKLAAGDDSTATQSAAKKMSAQTPAELEALLGTEAGSVSTVQSATVAVEYEAAPLVDMGPSNQETTDNGPLIGGVVGGVMGFLIILALAVALYTRNQNKKQTKQLATNEEEDEEAPVLLKGGAVADETKDSEPAVVPSPTPIPAPSTGPPAIPFQQEWLASEVAASENSEAAEEEEAKEAEEVAAKPAEEKEAEEGEFSGDDDEPKSPALKQAFV